MGHHRQAQKAVKKQRDAVDDHKGRDADSHRGSCRSGGAVDLIADVGGAVHRHGAGRRLGDGDHIQKFLSGHPLFFLDEFVLQQGDHGIAAAKGKRADLQECPEQGRNFFHSGSLPKTNRLFVPCLLTISPCRPPVKNRPARRESISVQKAAQLFSFSARHGILNADTRCYRKEVLFYENRIDHCGQ